MKCIIKNSRGFTLVEIMVVVIIIGITLAMAIPSFKNIRMSSQNSRLKNDLRTFADAFDTYAIENGFYPPDSNPGVIPPGMEEYLSEGTFTSKAAIGGLYDWDFDVFGITAAISVDGFNTDQEQLEKFDRDYDNDDLDSGIFRNRSGGYMQVILE